VYGLEDTDGRLAIAMELVEGPTLAERVARGRIPVVEALGIARQIAEAAAVLGPEREEPAAGYRQGAGGRRPWSCR